MTVLFLGIHTLYGQTPYCTKYMGTPSPNDPTLPDLPDQFQTIVEANIVNGNYSITAYEYFDNPGNRAVVRSKKNNIDSVSLFDYTNNQVLYIVGETCTVKNLAKAGSDVMFGYLSKGGIPHIFNTAGALHYMKSAGQEYMGKATVRGIRVDQWRSCLYWPQIRANFTLDYYFSVQSWLDPIAFPKIPVRAHVQGETTDFMGAISNVEHYYDFIDFRTSIKDYTVFEQPPAVACPGRVTKPIPQVPNYFHATFETFVEGQTVIDDIEFWYDQTQRLVRYDRRLPVALAGIPIGTPVAIIDDYTFGVKYVRDKTTDHCQIMPIPGSEQTAAFNRTATDIDYLWFKLAMKRPEELLGINGNFTYIGKRTARGLLCDVFMARRMLDMNWVAYEYYFLAEGITMYPDDDPDTSHSVPVQLIITNDTLGIKITQTITTFSEDAPELTVFDISPCYPDNSSVLFSVRFQGAYKTGLRDGIIREAQIKLAAVMRVSPLRVQNVLVNYDNSFVYISAKLMDVSPILKQFTLVSAFNSYTMNDITFSSSVISTAKQCAMFCVSNMNFTCNSFDFCARDKTHICRLSRRHTVGKKTESKGVECNHYSRTVDGRTHSQITILQAYANLKSAIFDGQLQLQTFLPYMSDPIMFTAVDLTISYGRLYDPGVPQFTGQFSYHLESTLPALQQVFNSHIWYDYEYKLVRYDLLDNGPVSKIHDYNSGLAYVINKKTMQCQVSPISNTSFDVHAPTRSQLNRTGYVLRIKNPLQLFDLTQNFIFVGQKTIRGILCDAYENIGQFDFGAGMIQSVFQFYFMTKTWKELSENSGKAVATQPIGLVVTSGDSRSTIHYGFSDFNEQHPDLTNFNIRPCFAGNQQIHFVLQFNQTYHPTLDQNLAVFVKNVQMQISVLTGVSPLRFQNPQVSYDGPNTFYIATMVEQSPSILDFTKISNMVGEYSMDATYVSIGSDIKCANICRNITGFKCLSFDYCPSTKACQLSKQHTPDGQLLKQNADCDHYSKTVDATSRPEPTTDQAITILQDTISRGGLVVNIQVGAQTTVRYQVQYFSRNIIRNDFGKENSDTLAHFNSIKQRAILIRNIPTARWIRYTQVSVDDCATKCLTHASFDCESYSYCANLGSCFLSDLHPDQNASAFVDSPLCNLYSRKFTDRYTLYAGTFYIANHGNTRMIPNTATADICAKQCSRSAKNTCKSFDFCSDTNTCYISKEHRLHLSSGTSTGNITCMHYSRKYLFDFTVTPNKHLAYGQSYTLTNTTVDNCAKVCVENTHAGFTCKSFMFCGHMTCNIFPVQSKHVLTQIGPNAVCDLYTRHISPTEALTATQPAPQTSQQTGYSAGSMAAVAFGALVPGIVLGAAILYFFKTKKLVDRRHEHEMNIIANDQLADDT